ncbi:peptide deformylase [Enterovirga rhinocerotis]|uniref:Peptide deformylase-like n=1 Tax=Enterovirga rhinocerotis TaxID=1339210 RepID=A0A4R7BJG8_9HYPH|nr:peptide deformylase [Enterovirga rhinocerotis]TDR85133.1 peptide deformylase [Enterovirga rhinocerotis]
MAVRPLLLFPDARLRQPAAPVVSFDPDLAALAADLRDTLASVSAIGLTAPHIGEPWRVAVIRMEPGDPVRTYVNPSVSWSSDETQTHDEGSVSMPGMRERIERPARLHLRYRDLAGTPCEEEASGFAAAVIQHEIDQLDGIFWIDRLSRLKRDRLVKRFGKQQRV